MKQRRERRAHHRIPCPMLVTIEHGQRTWSGFVRDYSEGGVFLACNAPVSPGDRVIVWLQRPEDGAVVELPAEVRRVTPRPGHASQRLGLKFAPVMTDAMTVARLDPVENM